MTFKALIANKTGDEISTDLIDTRSLTQSGALVLALVAALSSSAAGGRPVTLRFMEEHRRRHRQAEVAAPHHGIEYASGRILEPIAATFIAATRS